MMIDNGPAQPRMPHYAPQLTDVLIGPIYADAESGRTVWDVVSLIGWQLPHSVGV